jgi:tight adherence protein B
MLLPILVFIVATGGLIAAYFAATALPGYLAARRVDRRLRDVTMDAAESSPIDSDTTVVKKAVSGPLAAIDRLLSGTRFGLRLTRLIEQSGARVTPGVILVMSLGSAVVCGLALRTFVRNPFAGPFGLIVGALVPFLWLLRRRSKRFNRFEEQFPEALDLLSRAIRAGHAFQTAMGMVADEMPDPVGPEFKRTFEQQNYGLPLRDALNELADRLKLLDVRFFVTAVLIQRDTGGNLSEILDNLAHVVRERFKIKRQVRVHTAHGRFTGWVLLALPAFLAIALSVINPDHMHALFHERLGQQMLMAAVVMQAVGYFWIRQVIKIEV